MVYDPDDISDIHGVEDVGYRCELEGPCILPTQYVFLEPDP